MRKKPIKSSYKTINKEIGIWFKGGGFSISSPTAMHYNGSNYYLGYERYDEAQPSKMWIVKQTDSNIETNNINTGTANPDILDHTTPIFGGFKNGYIYVMQCDGWIKPIRVYKSSAPETITGTWTYVGDFGTIESYIWTVDGNNLNDMWFVTRSGDNGAGFNFSLLNVDLDDPTNYTKLQLTDTNYGVTNVRHYPQCAYFSGTSDYRCLFINHRKDGTLVTYKISIILKKLTDDVVHDFALSTSKDITISGELTTAELEADYVLVGTDSNKTVWNILLASVQIDNDVYVITSEPTGTYLKKYTIGSLTPTASYTLPWFPLFYVYNTGSKLLLIGKSNNNTQIVYTINYDLTGFSKIKDITGLIIFGDETGVPYNIGDVSGKYLIVGNAESGDDGNVRMTLTSDSWI